MEKPYKFFALHKQTSEIRYFNHELSRPYQPGHVSDEDYQWTIYIDTRYAARLRLYNYIHKVKPVRYSPYAGTETGKSIPILNF